MTKFCNVGRYYTYKPAIITAIGRSVCRSRICLVRMKLKCPAGTRNISCDVAKLNDVPVGSFKISTRGRRIIARILVPRCRPISIFIEEVRLKTRSLS